LFGPIPIARQTPRQRARHGKALEERIDSLNREFAGRGRLPWQGKLE
jgi:hypothetical protein